MNQPIITKDIANNIANILVPYDSTNIVSKLNEIPVDTEESQNTSTEEVTGNEL